MESLSTMFGTHPNSGHVPHEVVSLVLELMTCETACTICADACLSEPDVQMLARCIAVNQNCADLCAATSRLAARMGHHDKAMMQHQIQACREACRICAQECEQHEHEHCRMCAESCRRCEQACDRVLQRAMVIA